MSKQKEVKSKFKSGKQSEEGEVLLKVGPLKYKLPGKRQRVIVGSIVVGLNVLLVAAVIIYFLNPDFQDFIYNVGR